MFWKEMFLFKIGNVIFSVTQQCCMKYDQEVLRRNSNLQQITLRWTCPSLFTIHPTVSVTSTWCRRETGDSKTAI